MQFYEFYFLPLSCVQIDCHISLSDDVTFMTTLLEIRERDVDPILHPCVLLSKICPC